MRQDETWHRLRDWTYGQTPSERLAAQVLLAEDYVDVDPSHPLGGRDGLADALAQRDAKRWVMAVYFAHGEKSFREVKDKFEHDLSGVGTNGADGFVFVTNQELTRGERETLTARADVPVQLYHLERLAMLLDQPKMHLVREQYLYIPATTPAGLDAAARLAELMRGSIARCVERWLAVGLPRGEAITLAEDLTLGVPRPPLLPNSEHPVVVWMGGTGSGKSIMAERKHQSDLRAFRVGEDSPIPTFLRAIEGSPSLSDAVIRACSEIGNPRRVGARVVVDGLDETAADGMLAQARVLAGTWPSTTIVLSSRPAPAMTAVSEHCEIPQLSPEDQQRCVEIGAGATVDQGRIAALPDAVRATLAYPMFALLTGLWIRQRQEDPRAPIDLLRMLGERASRELAVDQGQLRTLAAKSVARDLGPVPVADIGGIEMSSLLGTGMVAERPGGLAFGLPAIAQWFAAQALLLGEISISELLAAPEDLELWRAPLGLGIAAGSSADADRLIGELVAGEAGFTCRVLNEAVGQAVVVGLPAPPWREGARRARHALQTIADAVGPLAPLVACADATGRVLPMAAASSQFHLTIAFFRDPTCPEISPLSGNVEGLTGSEKGLMRTRSTQVGEGAAWPWRWALQGVQHDLKRVLEHRALPVASNGPLADEEAWAAALDLLNESPLLCPSVPLDDALAAIAKPLVAARIDHETFLTLPGRRVHNLTALRRYLLRMKAAGHTELQAPLPVADRDSGGSTGDFYSDERPQRGRCAHDPRGAAPPATSTAMSACSKSPTSFTTVSSSVTGS